MPNSRGTTPAHSASQQNARTTRNARLVNPPTAKDESTAVTNSQTARDYLEKLDIVKPEDDYTLATLSAGLFNISTLSVTTSRLVIDGIRAVAFAMGELESVDLAKNIVDSITKVLEKPLATLSSTVEKVNEAADTLRGSANSVTGTIEEFREECTRSAQQVTEAAEGLASQQHNSSPPNSSNTASYADAAKNGARVSLPPEYAAVAARNVSRSRQILIDKLPGSNSTLDKLTELELVAKANLTLDCMGLEATDRPEGTEFVSVRRLANGGVVYDLTSSAAAEWLRREDVRKAFLHHFGSASTMKDRAYYIIGEYAPTSFNPDALGALERIEKHSGLKTGTFYHVHWLKPVGRRSDSQTSAHLIMGCLSAEGANLAIRNGLVIEGKKISARKLMQDPKRCLKCQAIGKNHMAANCPNPTDICGTCGDNHRTVSCNVRIGELGKYRCVNCNSTGHAAWDRLCPTFLAKCKRFDLYHPENQLKYYLRVDDPSTWEKLEEPRFSTESKGSGDGEGLGVGTGGRRDEDSYGSWDRRGGGMSWNDQMEMRDGGGFGGTGPGTGPGVRGVWKIQGGSRAKGRGTYTGPTRGSNAVPRQRAEGEGGRTPALTQRTITDWATTRGSQPQNSNTNAEAPQPNPNA